MPDGKVVIRDSENLQGPMTRWHFPNCHDVGFGNDTSISFFVLMAVKVRRIYGRADYLLLFVLHPSSWIFN